MNYQNKTKEELITELQEVQQKYGSLNATFENEKLILAKLINASEEFIQFTDATIDYRKILQIILDISRAKYASFNIFDDNGLDFTTVAFAGINENIEKASSFLGFEIVNKHWNYDPVRDEKTKQQTITQFVHLHDLVGDIISKSVIYLIEKTFSIGETFVVKIVKENKTLGDFTLLFKKGETLINNEFVDLYAHQVGLFLDRDRTTNLLRVNEARHSAMISNISDVIGIIGLDGIMKYKSPNIEKWFGWQPQDLVGTDGWLTVHPDDLERIQKEFFTLLEKDNSVKTVEYRYKCKNGSYKPIKLTATNLTNDPIIGGVLLNYHDITERKQAELEIKLKNEELSKLNSEKDKFFSIIAHDMRSPFNAFLGFTRMMVEELNTMSLEEIRTIVVSMRKSATNLYSLLENLLEWSMMQRGVITYTPVSIPLALKIKESIALIIGSVQKKEIEISCDIPNGLSVFADLHMVESLIRNLISNAVKFTPKGGRITVSANKIEGNFIEIAVRDTGIGMKKELMSKLFKLDEHTGRKGTEGEPSTGLGLIICKDFIERHGAKIWAESEEGKGTTFFIELQKNEFSE